MHACYSTEHKHTHVDAITPEDHLAIIDLLYWFDKTLNDGNQHKLGQLFTGEAEVHHPKGKVKGVDQLVEYFKSCAPLARGNRHLTLHPMVEPVPGAGGHAAYINSYRLLHRAAMPPVLLATGTIEDEVVKSKVDGRWRFLNRRFVMDPPSASAEQQQQALQQQ